MPVDRLRERVRLRAARLAHLARHKFPITEVERGRAWNPRDSSIVFVVVNPVDNDELADAPTMADGEFFESAWPGLVRLGRLLTGSQQGGEDLAQDAIVNFLRSGVDVQHRRAYLRRSMVNLSLNQARRSAVERRHLHLVSGDTSIGPPEPDDMWPLIVRLPARQRAVLVLRYYEDLSESDIASVLGCRPGTVKSLASRALTQLRKDYSDHD